MTASHQRARTGGDLRVLRAAVFTAVCVVLAAAGHSIASCATVPLWSLGVGFLAVFAVAAPLAGRERSLPGITVLLATGQTVLHTLFGLGQHGTTVTASATSTASVASSGVDASLVARAARLVCGASIATLSPAQAQRILADAQLGTGNGNGAGTGAGTPHAVHEQAGALPTALGSPSSGLASVLPSLPMLLGHVLAAVATGWLLRRGDIALRRLLRLSAHGMAEGPLISLRGALALVRALLSGLPGGVPAMPGAPRGWAYEPPVACTTALQHSVSRRGPPAGEALALAA
ncbi:hypothetical protein [Streptomyces ortus]|jgi:hypothetical protein|uniref:Integral membrane protein n=1 Tax=Streptomyces ortus TaxID=2867268 RepID=A0ABT3V5Z8_9ACTN|nr:hypothetical protein [Streptomyces ortus]MCX4235424.1 hypothetical protein [Streptomyces ortus]